MHLNRLAQWLRIPAIALFSILLASCGSGDGEDPVVGGADDVLGSGFRLLFEDDFGGPAGAPRSAGKAPLTVDKWRTVTGYGPANDGWGNDEWQLYQNSIDNLYVEDGALVIEARCDTAPVCNKRDGSVTSARITTKDKFEFKYGNIQARIKVPGERGMWPAFWMLGSGWPESDWPDVGEIDIMEMLYEVSDPQTVHFNLHWAGPNDAPTAAGCSGVPGFADPANETENCFGESKTFGEPLSNGFHVYEVIWSDRSIVGKIDGITYFYRAIDPGTMEEFQSKFFMLLNVGVGGAGGDPSNVDWTQPQKMEIDWVRVYQVDLPSTGTLIAETGRNLDYNRIIQSQEFNGNEVTADLNSTAVPALEGNQVLQIDYTNSTNGNPGGPVAGFGGIFFSFNSADATHFTNLVFSIDDSAFPGLDLPNTGDLTIELKDTSDTALQVLLSNYTPISGPGNWKTYNIPLSAFAGVDISSIQFLGFLNPKNSLGQLINGTLYIDGIKLITTACNALPSISLDETTYNPVITGNIAKSVGQVTVNDLCAASSLATVGIETGTDEIVVGVDLDSAGEGSTIFGFVDPTSVCPTSDENSYIALTDQLIATYKSASATAFIGPSGPTTTSITGETFYFYSTDPNQPKAFLADTPGPNNFNYSGFDSGTVLEGSFSGDARNPVFQVASGSGYGAEVAQIALINIRAGFAVGKEFLNFKFKNPAVDGSPNDAVKVEFGIAGGFSQGRVIVLDSSPYSNPIGDDWYEISVPVTGDGWQVVVNGALGDPITDFANLANYNFISMTSADPAPTTGNGFYFLMTDIFLEESIQVTPDECAELILPPVQGSGTGATGATGGPFSVSFDDMNVAYSFVGFGNPDTINSLNNDPLDPNNLVAQTTKPVGSQVWAGVTVETTPGITWPVSVAESEITIRIYSPGPGLVVHMKLEESGNDANFVEAEAVTTVATGWETLTFDFASPVSGSINPAFDYDKLSLFFGFNSVGDGTIYTWDSIEFLGTGGIDLPFSDDFESGDLDGWTAAPNGGTITADDTQAGGGTYSARLVAGPSQAPALSIEGLAAGSVSPGDTIDVSWDMCGSFAGGGEVLFPALISEPGGGAGGVRVFDTIASVPGVWTRYTRSFTADATPGNVDAGVSVQFDVVCGGDGGCAADVFFDNVNVTNGGGDPGSAASGLSCAGGGGGGSGAVSDYAYANNPAEMVDLVAAAIDGFGSGSTIIPDYALDPDYNRAYFVASGSGYCPTCNIAQLGFQGIGAGFAAAYDTFNFKIKATNLPTGEIQVALHGGGDPLHTYSVTDLSVSTALGNDWYQMSIPMSDFTNIAGSTGFLFEYGNPPAPFDFLVTDIVFTTTVTDYAYANNPAEMVDLVAAAIDGFGSGSTITPDYALDPDYNRAYFVASGSGYCPTCNIAQLGFQGIGAGFAAAYDTFNFKIKATNLPTGEIQVALHGGGDPLHTYSVTDLSVSTALGNDWYQMSIPMSDFTNIAGSTGFLFEYGNPPVAFDFLVTDIVFIDNGDIDSGTGGGGGGGELTINGDFELGDISGWEDFSAANNGTFTATMAEASPLGSASVWSGNLVASVPGMGGPASFPVVKQPNVGVGTVTPNTAMTVSFDLKGSLTGGGGVIFVEFFSEISGGGTSAAGIISQPTPNSSWVNYNIPVTTGSDVSGGVTLQLKADCGANAGCIVDAYFDNVSITID